MDGGDIYGWRCSMDVGVIWMMVLYGWWGYTDSGDKQGFINPFSICLLKLYIIHFTIVTVTMNTIMNTTHILCFLVIVEYTDVHNIIY